MMMVAIKAKGSASKAHYIIAIKALKMPIITVVAVVAHIVAVEVAMMVIS